MIVTSKARRALPKLAAVAILSFLFCSTQCTDTTSATDEQTAPTNSLPSAILQLFQKQAASPPQEKNWGQVSTLQHLT
jgi:hypothetical protein